ncbi:LacI family DNA-binding transcriptional regulator [Coraliomargarita sp. SDUM461004]|uniref:LacI family DNA-binding transcriptional regulator n=1 Tax=Thalassobacterium sedimentorum TaxID=3041258 RepID=A0ABU1AJD6_9BACT|nr:LacI family DNA-binding transcriptional regulator [Coraliomargarita sp. SDUM461004]MDQ8193866.1 LacI family DNA-binding transcriptional regulator [Coraliomargarita sp. SDUM461004]
MRDVAAKAGVDPSTVSLALRNSPRLPEKTRLQIQKIAAELGYKANPYVSALMQHRSRGRNPDAAPTLAYLTSHPTRAVWKSVPYLKRFYLGCEAEASRLGWKLEEFWTGDVEWKAERLGKIMAYRSINAVLVAPVGCGEPLQEFPWMHFHSVAIGSSLKGFGLHYVRPNYFINAQICVQACLERGYRRIGFAVSAAHNHRLAQRHLGGCLVFQQLDLSLKILLPPHFDENDSLDQLIPWIRKENVEVILTIYGQDQAVDSLRAAGLRVPEDVAVVSLAVSPDESMSGVDEKLEVIGNKSVQMLVGMLPNGQPGEQTDPTEVLVKGNWKDGSTLPKKKPSH